MAKTNGAKGGTMKKNATKKNAGRAAQGTTKKATKTAAKAATKAAAKATTKTAAKAATKAPAKAATKAPAKATTKGAAKAAKKGTGTGETDTSHIEATLKAKAPVVVDIDTLPEPLEEPPPSVSTPPIRRLSWGYALLSEITDESMSERHVEAGTKVAIEGELDRLAYVYVVQVADDRTVEILYPPNGGSRRVRPGTRMRIPGGSGWIITTKRCKLRTIASTYPLTDEQVGKLA